MFGIKRNIKKNIFKGNPGIRLRRIGMQFLLLILVIGSPVAISSCAGGKNASQKRVEKEKERKDKEARKKYEMAVKRHEKNQSPTTRSMMKETKKESPKNTPLKRSSGKKCK
jgi:hypothetical protein